MKNEILITDQENYSKRIRFTPWNSEVEESLNENQNMRNVICQVNNIQCIFSNISSYTKAFIHRKEASVTGLQQIITLHELNITAPF